MRAGVEHATMVARYQNPAIARFLSIDPITLIPSRNLLMKPQELNSYSYVANNPLKYIDPTGEKVELVFRSLGGFSANGKITHSFLRITPENSSQIPNIKGVSDKSQFTLGGYNRNGMIKGDLVKNANDKTDRSMADYKYNIGITIHAPDGVDPVDFERNIVENYNSMSDTVDSYSVFGNPGFNDQANCHNVSSQLLMDSGVDSNTIKSALPGGKIAPGLGQRADTSSWARNLGNKINNTWQSSKQAVGSGVSKLKSYFK